MGMSSEENVLVPIKIKLDIKVKSVACGDWHTVIIDETGTCHGTGYNKAGCLGLTPTVDSHSFTKIPIPTPITTISCGRNITLFLTN